MRPVLQALAAARVGMMGFWTTVLSQLSPGGGGRTKKDARLNPGERTITSIPGIDNLENYAEVVEDEEGYWRIEEVAVSPDIDEIESPAKREELRKKMTAYFSAKSEIFDTKDDAKAETGAKAEGSPNAGGGTGAGPAAPEASAGHQSAADSKPAQAVEGIEDFAPLFWHKEDSNKSLQASLSFVETILWGGACAVALAIVAAILTPEPDAKGGAAAFAFGVVAILFSAAATSQWRTFRRVHNDVLKDGYLYSGVWPGFLETRLIKEIRDKFPAVDDDMRALADLLARIFLHNLERLVALKRSFQKKASNDAIWYGKAAIYAAAASGLAVSALLSWLTALNDALPVDAKFGNFTYLALIVSTAAAIGCLLWRLRYVEMRHTDRGTATMAGDGPADATSGSSRTKKDEVSALDFFERDNKQTTDAHYLQSLKRTCEKISTAFQLRLKSIDGAIKSANERQALYFRDGQESDANTSIEAMRLKDGFFLTQLILWLSKRSEYQQLYIKDRMHQMQRQYFFVDIEGYRQAHKIATGLSRKVNRMALWGLAANIAAVAAAIGFGHFFGVTPAELPWIVAFSIIPSVFVTAWVWKVSQDFVHLLAERSYTNEEWNPRFDRLRDALKTDDWKTFDKIRVDEILAMQFQRALGAIHTAEQALRRPR